MAFPQHGTPKFANAREFVDWVVGKRAGVVTSLGTAGGGMRTRNNVAKSLTDGTAAQSPFASAADAFTVEPGIYHFKGQIILETGNTSHATSFGLGGTATYTSVQWCSIAKSAADDTLATPQMGNWEGVSAGAFAAAAVTAASTAVETVIIVEGEVDVLAGGTLIPQITFGAAPGGTNTAAIGSFFELTRIGPSGTVGLGAVA